MSPKVLITPLFACAALLWSCGPQTSERLEAVRALHAAGRASETIDELRAILETAPDTGEADYLLGVALLANQQPTPAVFPLARAAESPELAVSAGLKLCQALNYTQNFQAAARAADAALSAGADLADGLSCKLDALKGLRDWEATLTEASRLIAEAPGELPGWVAKAAALDSLKRHREAIESWARVEQLAGASDRTSLAARACVESSGFVAPESTPAEIDATVQAHLEACVERYPAEPIVHARLRDLYQSAGELEQAADALRAAIAADPGSLPARLELAAYFAAIDRPSDAEQVLIEATRAIPVAAAWEALAEQRRSRGDLAGAVDSMRSARKQAPGDERISFKLADLLVDVGDLDGALELEKSLASPANRMFIRARVSFERGAYRRALEELEKGLLQWPDNPGARVLAGRAAAELGEFDRALSEYREAIRADAGRLELVLLASQLALAEGRSDEAFEYLIRHLTQGESSVAALEAAIHAAHAAGRERWVRALRARLRAEHGAEALALVDAREASLHGDPARAAELIRAAGLPLDRPENESALHALVEASIAAGQVEDALGVAVDARRAAPERACLRAVEGRVQLELGQYEAARTSFQTALEGDRGCAAAMAGLGSLAIRAGQLEQALEYLDRAVEVDPTRIDVKYRAAQVALALQRVEDAEQRLREVLRVDPGNAGAANDLAWILAEQGRDLDAALALAERSFRLAPSSRVYDTLAYVRLRRGETSEAIELLEEGTRVHPEDPQLFYRLGAAYASAEKTEPAVDALQSALAKGDFGATDEARALLVSLQADRSGSTRGSREVPGDARN